MGGHHYSVASVARFLPVSCSLIVCQKFSAADVFEEDETVPAGRRLPWLPPLVFGLGPCKEEIHLSALSTQVSRQVVTIWSPQPAGTEAESQLSSLRKAVWC